MNACVSRKIRNNQTQWYVVVTETDFNGKPKKVWRSNPETGKAFTRKRDAEKFRADLVSANNKGAYVSPSKLLFGELIEDYVALKKIEIAPSTYAKYEQLMRVHIKPNLGNIPVQRLSETHLDTLYVQLLENGKQTNHKGGGGLSAASVRHIHVLVNGALARAVKRGLVVKNVAQNATVPRTKNASNKTTILNVEELNRFIHGVQGHEFETLFKFYALTGCRRGEALALRWRNVDWVNSTVKIEETLGKIKGKVSIGSPKTTNSYRTILISPELLRLLDRISLNQHEHKQLLGAGYANEDFVFCETDGNNINPNRVSRAFERVRDSLGLPQEVRLHDLRATHATILLANSTNPKYVAQRLGDTVETVMSFYAKVLPTEGQAALERFDSLLTEAQQTPRELRSA
jgi:integrase